MSGIDMIESIKSSGAENGFFERWAGFQASANIQTVKQLRNDSFFLSIPVLLQELSNAVILTIGVWLIMKGKFSVGMLVAFQSLLQQFMMPVESLLDIGQSIQETRTSMERVQDVMKYASDNSYVKTFSEDDITEFEKLKGTKTQCYYPLITKQEYTRKVLDGVKEDLFGGSLSSLVRFFVKEERISEEELKEMLKMVERQGDEPRRT